MSLSKNDFERRTSNGGGLFPLLGSDFAQSFSQIVSISLRVKILNNTILVASRHIEREKASLPVDMCHSKMPLFKLPFALVFNRDDYYDEVMNR